MRSGQVAATAAFLWAASLIFFLDPLFPISNALVYPIYEDDGVYVGAAQLAAQGLVPYRDFFFQHPPLGALAYLPAVLYHFAPWGSAINFALARYWSSSLASLTVALIFLCTYVATGRWSPSVLAALAAMLDSSLGYVARQTLLDVPMLAADTMAVLSVLLALDRGRLSVSAAAGALTAVAALCKLPGLGLAVPATFLLWRRDRRLAWAYLATFMVVFMVGLGSAVALAGPTALYQIFAYQALRPMDGTVGLWARLGELASAPHRQLLGVLLISSIGCLAFRHTLSRGLALLAATWGLLILAALMTSRSFYPHYLADAVAGAYLGLGAVLAALSQRRFGPVASLLVAGLLVAVGARATLGQLSIGQDRIYVIVSRYIAETTQPPSRVLSLNPLFNYLAGRPLPEGWGWRYMLDSYGSMVYTGLGLPPPGEAVSLPDFRPSSTDVWELVKGPAPQMLILSRLRNSDLVIIDAVGEGRIGPRTAAKLEECFDRVERQARYTIFRARPDTGNCVVGGRLDPPLRDILGYQAGAPGER